MSRRKPIHSQNLLHGVQRRSPKTWWRRRRLWLPIGLGLALAAVALSIVPPAQSALAHGRAAKAKLEEAQKALNDQAFDRAVAAADEASSELRSTRLAASRLSALNYTPYLGRQLRAAEVLLDVGSDLTLAFRDGVIAIQEILGPLQAGQGTISLATLTPADKRQILGRLAEAEPQLTSVKSQIESAVVRFTALPNGSLVPQLQTIISQLREQLPFLQDTVTQLIPATKIIPAIAGFPDAQTYLFLLQNNTELRPTGGFIGTYGILKVASGEITSFITNDVYNLDTPAKDRLHLKPPAPLTRYNDTTQWFFRDSNWSPDFPTSAEKALEFYRLEGGPQKQLDGVIAVTPTFISSLLKISGDITIDKITFTPDNLIDRLQPLAARKELIGEMSKVLMNRILALPQRRWQELISSITTALEERHALLYSRNPRLESQILSQRWGGALTAPAVDGFAVVDANLASLKTDSVIDRVIDYDMKVENSTATATLKIEYVNTGSFSATTTRYRTYTRVYLPKGSQLISSTGALRDDKIRSNGRPGTVDVFEELDQTVFGAFISIEPGTTGTLSFTYTLPPNVSQAATEGVYDLSVQKQAGTRNHKLTVRLNFPRDVSRVTGVDGSSLVGHTGVALTTDLRRSRHMVVTF